MIKQYESSIKMSKGKEEEDENYDYDELMELYEVKKKMEKDMKELWENVVCRYIEHCDEQQILMKLSPKYDYDKFYGFMVENNEMYKYVLGRIMELEK